MNEQSSDNAEITVDYKKPLGSGGFGDVFQGTFGTSPAAIKEINIGIFQSQGENLLLGRKLNHDNIVRLYGKKEEPRLVYLAMELCAGTLEDLIDGTYSGPSPGTTSQLMLQVTLGLQYLHSNRIIHRDLKPQNILISLPSGNDGSSCSITTMPPKMKIADFGLCKELRYSERSKAVSRSRIGTVGWAPPELFSDVEKNRKQSYSADVFSLGCVFGFAFTGGCHPFGNNSVLRPANILEGNVKWENEDKIMDRSLRALIRRMIDKKRELRPSIDDIIRHRTFIVVQSQVLSISSKSTPDNLAIQQYVWPTESSIQDFDMESLSNALRLLQLEEDGHDKMDQLIKPFLTWSEYEIPNLLLEDELKDSPRVHAIACLLTDVDRLVADEDKKREFRKQIMKRALLFDVRMPKWLSALDSVVTAAQAAAVNKALDALPEMHRLALVGKPDLFERIFKLHEEKFYSAAGYDYFDESDKSDELNETIARLWKHVFCWSKLDSTRSSSDNEDSCWHLFTARTVSSDVVRVDEDNDKFFADQLRAQKAMTEAWLQDRTPPAFYLAAANGNSAFCQWAFQAMMQYAKQTDKDKLKDFAIELLYYALNVTNDESLALECFRNVIPLFTENEFYTKFPCALLGPSFRKNGSTIVRLIAQGWFRLIAFVMNISRKDGTEKIQLKDAFSRSVDIVGPHPENREFFIKNLTSALNNIIALQYRAQVDLQLRLTHNPLSFDLVEIILWGMHERKVTGRAIHGDIVSCVCGALDMLWNKTSEASMVRFFCGAGQSNLSSCAIRNPYRTISCLLLHEITTKYIPERLSDEGFRLFIEILTTRTDSWGFTGCVLFIGSFADITKTMFYKIVYRISSTMGHEKLEQFLFTPTHMTRCLIIELLHANPNVAPTILNKFALGQEISERIVRFKPILTSLDFMVSEDGSLRWEVIESNGTALLETLLIKCYDLNARGVGTAFSRLSRAEHDAVDVKTLVAKEDFSYLITVLEHLVKLMDACIDNTANREHYERLTRPIFEIMDDSYRGSCSNGLGVLMLFAFVRMMKEARSGSVCEFDVAQQHQVMARGMFHFHLRRYNVCFCVFFGVHYAEHGVKNYPGRITGLLRNYGHDIKRLNRGVISLNQLIDGVNHFLLEEIPRSNDFARFDVKSSSFFANFAKFLLYAAITNDWLKISPNDSSMGPT